MHQAAHDGHSSLTIAETAADPERAAQREVHRGEKGERSPCREDPAAPEQDQHRGTVHKFALIIS